MSQVRRSARISTKSSLVSQDEAEEVRVDVDTAAKGQMRDGDSTGDESSEEENSQDEDYEEPSNSKKRKASGGRSRTTSKRGKSEGTGNSKASSSRGNASSLTGTKRDREQFLQTIKDFQPTELFEILATSEDASIDELARNWLENYNENRDIFLQEFINLLLCCCGTIARVEEHDVHSNESSNETIGEVQLIFQRQKIHEFHLLISKNHRKKTKYPHLYNNFVEFMSRLMDLANEAQLIYLESTEENGQIVTGPFVLDLLTWLSALSVCKVRCFRYISTLTLYLFQDYLTEHIVDLERKYLSKLSKQLKLEQQKKRPNNKTLEKLESAIDEIQNSKIITRDIIDNIIKLCFVHRFKDVDDRIRCLSMIHLSVWIQNYPEYFMKATFLKYYGWLLSDSSAEVRSQVLKLLPQLIAKKHKKPVDNSAIRQFYERFKERIIEIARNDENLEVRLHAVNVLVEVAALGYLEDSEVLAISSLIFENNEIKVSSRGKNSRFLVAAGKFFAEVTNERYEEFAKDHELPSKIFDVQSASVIRVGIFARLLNESLVVYLQDKQYVDPKKKINILFQAAEFLYPSFGSLIEDICRLLTYDGEFDHPALIKEKQTDEEEEGEGNESELLLPTEGNSTILFVIVLYGLCYGGIKMKSQPRFHVAEAILPWLHKLMTQLPLQSSNVLTSLTGICNLFSFEDWIHTGHERDLHKTVELVVKAFTEVSLSCSQSDSRYNGFSEYVQHVKQLGLEELDELWINQILHLKILLEKFLDERMTEPDNAGDFEENTNVLNTRFIGKLTLLGKFYPVEFDPSLQSKFLENYVLQLPSRYTEFDQDTLRGINFNILALLVSWKYQKWTAILKAAVVGDADRERIPNPDLQSVSNIVETLQSVFNRLNRDGSVHGRSDNFLLKWSISNPLVDIIISTRVVELSIPDSERSLKTLLIEKFPRYLQEDIGSALLAVFLYLESLTSQKLRVHLDRFSEEDVNLNDIDDELVSKDCEKQLLIFTIKLKGLIKLGLLHGEPVSRIALNKDKLGMLFTQVIDDTIFDEEKKSKTLGKTSHKGITSIREQSPEGSADIDMLQDDPIEDSEI